MQRAVDTRSFELLGQLPDGWWDLLRSEVDTPNWERVAREEDCQLQDIKGWIVTLQHFRVLLPRLMASKPGSKLQEALFKEYRDAGKRLASKSADDVGKFRRYEQYVHSRFEEIGHQRLPSFPPDGVFDLLYSRSAWTPERENEYNLYDATRTKVEMKERTRNTHQPR